MFPAMASTRGGSLPSSGSRRARFPAFNSTIKPLRLPATLARPLMSSHQGSACARLFRVRECALGNVRAHYRARSFVHPALLIVSGKKHAGVYGTSQVPWQPILRLCPILRPRPNRAILALTARPMLPPDPTRRRLRRLHDFEAATGLQRPLSTLHERRCRRPCKTRFRLAGSAFAVRASNPLGRIERFQVIHPPFQGLS